MQICLIIWRRRRPIWFSSGHIHGGHIRLFGKGFLQPNDGNGSRFFPKYDSGLFEQPDGMKMIESRGLGDQMIIPRLYNRPQLLLNYAEKSAGKEIIVSEWVSNTVSDLDDSTIRTHSLLFLIQARYNRARVGSDRLFISSLRAGNGSERTKI